MKKEITIIIFLIAILVVSGCSNSPKGKMSVGNVKMPCESCMSNSDCKEFCINYCKDKKYDGLLEASLYDMPVGNICGCNCYKDIY